MQQDPNPRWPQQGISVDQAVPALKFYYKTSNFRLNLNTLLLYYQYFQITMAISCINLLPVTLFLVIATAFASANVLVQFKTCSSLKNYMVTNALKRVGPWGLRTPSFCGRYYSRRSRRRSSRRAPQIVPFSSFGAAESVSAPVEGVDFSGTNVQVSGVDEPDIVKTDGSRVFAISNRILYYVKVNPNGSGGKILANVTIPSYPRDMLFDVKSDSVVVISQRYENVRPLRRFRRVFYPYSSSRPIIVLYRISVKLPWDVKITDTAYIQGRYISARSVDNVARLVLSYDGSNHISFVTPSGKLTQQEATKKNIEIIKKSSVSDWVPSYNATGTICRLRRCFKYNYKSTLATCSASFFPKSQFSGFSLLTVATFRLSGPFAMSGSSIVADGDKVYATAHSLYAATIEYQYDMDETDRNIGLSFKTSFHKFDLSAINSKYVGSGQVTGSVLNQFSMHEYDGTFFVATTDGAPWWGARNSSNSKVSSFRVAFGKKLQKVGEVGGLGKGERIYAVRYIADVAYIVTFRRVDPLYIVDLSNVGKLKVTGELKIPGYSAYLHPIGEGRILGVGRDATETGITTGAKVSLFDVSNVSMPKETATWTLKGSYSTAEWDHRAFLWWGPENMAVLPLSVYYRHAKKRFTGSIALVVTDEGIEERGRVSQRCCGDSWGRAIRRNFVIGRTNLWSLSYSALQVNDIVTLKKKSFLELQVQ